MSLSLPPLLKLENESAYRAHFEAVYCRRTIPTFDDIEVRFRKTVFCSIRAERIDWIKYALQDPSADLRVGWDNSRKCHRSDRRVAIVSGSYVVIIDILKCGRRARFVTSYVADSGPGQTLTKIKRSPKWRTN